jgi:Helix-turn-helix of insertion element transposase
MDASFGWSPTSVEAAQLIAVADLGIGEIAEKVGVTRQTLWAWRQHPEFIAEVERQQADIFKEIRRHGIAIVERRVAALNDRWKRMQRVIEARAVEHANVGGGVNGLFVRKLKCLGSGEHARIVEEYEVDTGLLAEMRAHEKQAAEELGQWTTKNEVDLKNEPERVEYEGIQNERDAVLPPAETS